MFLGRENRVMLTPRWMCVVVVLACGGALGGVSDVAMAAATHQFLEQITSLPAEGPHGETIAPPLKLSGVDAMTVDHGHLWVDEHIEGAGRRVDEWDASSGVFEAQLEQPAALQLAGSAIAVAEGTGEREVYVAASKGGEPVVGVFGPNGKLQGEPWTGSPTQSFSESAGAGQKAAITGLAVDRSSSLADSAAGDVYVSTASGGGVVDVFKPAAGGTETYVTQLTGTCASGSGCETAQLFSDPHGVAIDPSNGDVLVSDFTAALTSVVDVFEPVLEMPGQYRFLFQIAESPHGPFTGEVSVAVDGVAGDIYISQGSEGEAQYVNEFRLTSSGESVEYEGRLEGTPGGPFALVRSVTASSEEPQDLYVGDFDRLRGAGVIDIFGSDLPLPDVATEAASGVTPAAATLHGTVNPEGVTITACAFEYGMSTAYGNSAGCEPAAGEIGSGSSAVEVHATVAGLEPDTTYHLRLLAGNANGNNTSPDATLTTAGPGLRSESVTEVTSTSATLNASLNPHGSPARYFFQLAAGSLASCTPASCAGIPANPVSIGSVEGAVEVQQPVQSGISPGGTYHYRVVVESEPSEGATETFYGAEQSFTAELPTPSALPDGRQWEMVSPPEKRGAALQPIGSEDVTQAAADGNAFTYAAASPIEAQAAGYYSHTQQFSLRTAAGWVSREITPSHAAGSGVPVGVGHEYRFFSEDLSHAVLQPFGPFIPDSSPQALAPEEASEQTAMLRNDLSSTNPVAPCLQASMQCYRPLVSGCPPAGSECAPGIAAHADVEAGITFGQLGGVEGEYTLPCPPAPICGPQFVAATPDLSHIVLVSGAPLIQSPKGVNLYEWSAGQLALVSRLPRGEGGEATGGSIGEKGQGARGAISTDGSRVFWSSSEHGERLYMWDAVTGTSIRLDAVQGGVQEEGTPQALFQIADSEGSRVFFTDTQRLTANASPLGQRDLYECAISQPAHGEPECKLTDLTPSAPSGEPAAIQGTVLGAAEDGSSIYFVANGILGDGGEHGAVHGGCKEGAHEEEQTCNLYVSHEGAIHLIAVLSGADRPDWIGGNGLLQLLSHLTARVSPNGRWLAFMSARQLTGFDNHDAASGHPDEEVFLYNAETQKLTCASCNPTGARPAGEEAQSESLVVAGAWNKPSWLAANIPGWTPFSGDASRHQPRYLTDEGRLFFNSRDPLVPQAENGTWDVYEFEPTGVRAGSGHECSPATPAYTAANGGCLGLISSGTATEESAFLDASQSGADAFFLTGARLTPQDGDDALDVYDAHECSAVAPCPTPALEVSPPCHSGDACRPAPTLQPELFGPPSSATFQGPGNPPPPAASSKPKTAAQIRAEKLARALKACHRDRRRARRAACERSARRRYAVARARNSAQRKRRHH